MELNNTITNEAIGHSLTLRAIAKNKETNVRTKTSCQLPKLKFFTLEDDKTDYYTYIYILIYIYKRRIILLTKTWLN